jgi:hypothetical protein
MSLLVAYLIASAIGIPIAFAIYAIGYFEGKKHRSALSERSC